MWARSLLCLLVLGCAQGGGGPKRVGTPDTDDVVDSSASEDTGSPKDTASLDHTPVDVLLVVEDSFSMRQEQGYLVDAIPHFMEALRSGRSDWHVGVTTTDGTPPTLAGELEAWSGERYVHPGSELDPTSTLQRMAEVGEDAVSIVAQGFRTSLAAVDPETEAVREANAGFYRPAAELHVLVVSDEDDQSPPSLTPSDFVTAMKALKGSGGPRVTFSAITGRTGGCLGSGDTLPRYASAVAALDGSVYDICETDWTDHLSNFGDHVVGR